MSLLKLLFYFLIFDSVTFYKRFHSFLTIKILWVHVKVFRILALYISIDGFCDNMLYLTLNEL